MNIRASKFVQNLRGLTSTEKSVAQNMAIHASYKECVADMGMEKLAAESGLKNRETASRIVKVLEFTYGIIRAVGPRSGGRLPTKYTFTFTTNRDSGITVSEDGDDDNRDSGITVNRDSSRTNRDFDGVSTVTQNAPTVTGESHEGFKVKDKEGKEGRLDGTSTPSESPSKPADKELSGWKADFQVDVQRIAADKRIVFQVPLPDSVFEYVEKLGNDCCGLERAQEAVLEWLNNRSFWHLENPNVVWSKMAGEMEGLAANLDERAPATAVSHAR